MLFNARHRIIFIRISLAALLAMVTACAMIDKTDKIAVKINAEQRDLRFIANTACLVNDEQASPLYLHENISQHIESLASDGAVSAYTVNYTLAFRLGDNAHEKIQLKQVVSVTESRYLAGRQSLADSKTRLRLAAIRRLCATLTRRHL